MNKKSLFGLFAMASVLFTTSCQEEDLVPVQADTDVLTFAVSTQDVATRAATGEGSLANSLYYGVYEYVNGKWSLIDAISKTTTPHNPFTAEEGGLVTLRLARQKKYSIVFWAEEGAEGDGLCNVDWDARQLSVNPSVSANAESYDAFWAYEYIESFSGAQKKEVTLTRPFAQLNIGVRNDDLAAAEKASVDLQGSAITVKKVPTSMSLETGKVGDYEESSSVAYASADIPAASKWEFPVAGNTYLALNYVLVGTEQSLVDIDLTYTDTEGGNYSYAFTNIPVQRNYRTNIYGNILTASDDYEVDINPDFDGEENYPQVAYAEDLAAALTSDKENIAVTLTSDIELPISLLGQQTGGSGEYKLGGENTKNISIDLNGHKLTFTTTYWSVIGAKNAGATITIKSGTVTSSQPTGTWNSYDMAFANCNYIIEDVTFNKAVAFENEGKAVSLKNVTINETHDYYAMWITAEGQTVNIDGLTINSAGRGIKIDQQYVDTPAKVTLNIADAEFTTAKKAAILVGSKAGANITLQNINLADVQADGFNAVWVDEDYKNFADKVTVNGGSVVVEGTVATVATAEALQAAIDAAPAGQTTTIYLGADLEGNVTIVQKEGVNIVIDGRDHKYDGTFFIHGQARHEGAETLTFKNIQFATAKSGHYFIDSNSTASAERYAHNVTVEDCSFCAEGEAVKSAAAMRIRQGFDITVVGGKATDMHSLLQAYGCAGVSIDGVTIEGGKNGISFGTSTGLTLTNSNITAEGYGVRADGTTAKLEVSATSITAAQPVIVRKLTAGEYSLAVGEDVTLNTTGDYQIVFTNGSDDAEYVTPNGKFTLTGANGFNVFPEDYATVYVSNSSDLQSLMSSRESDYIKFENNIDMGNKGLNVNGDVTIDMDGKQFKSYGYSNDGFIGYSIYVEDKSKLTVKNANMLSDGFYLLNEGNVVFENGKFVCKASKNSRWLFYVTGKSTLTIKDGDFSIHKDQKKVGFIYANGEGTTVSIEGGNFANVLEDRAAISTANGGKVIITGGTFGFDPSTWVASGYVATKSGSTWTVAAE